MSAGYAAPRPGVTLLVRSFDSKAQEEDLAETFGSFGTIVAVKLIPKRRLAFVEFSDPVELQKVLAEGSNLQLAGGSCVVGPASGAAGARSDLRQAGHHVCPVCGREFTSRAKLRAHTSDPAAHKRPPAPTEWQSMDNLDEFDLRPGAMVADLPQLLRDLLRSYLRQALSGLPELAAFVDDCASRHPVALRVKELFESVESARVIVQHLTDLRARGSDVKHVFDLACGHGLVGLLVACRFSDLQVVAVDLEERPVWSQYLSAWRVAGKVAASCSEPLQNVRFARGDLGSVALGPASLAISVHACNEANLEVLERCRAAGASYAVVPCCIPERLYMDGNLRIAHLEDEARYAVMVGVVAAQYEAGRVTCIDRRITNRNMVILSRPPPSH